MMLYGSLTSPFVRKCRITAIECGLDDCMDVRLVSVLDQDDNHPNPLGFVPSLVTDDNQLIIDSRVICSYLANLGSGLPEDSSLEDQTLVAMADGMTDRAVSLTLETRRPESEQSSSWKARWKEAIRATIPYLEDRIPEAFTPGAIALTCALAYLDLRHETIDWRAGSDQLTEWFAAQSQRPSVAATEHPS